MAGNKHDDAAGGVGTTGHEWDGIREYNNPLPAWWLWVFYATIVFSIGYVIVYPALPGLTGNTKGYFEWSSRADLESAIAEVKAGQQQLVDKVAAADMNTIVKTDELRNFAVAKGAAIFRVNCSQCHGSGAQGFIGFPNLNDDSWIWGGKPEDIYTTILHGIRYASDSDTRVSEMPVFAGVLEDTKIVDVANYVMQLSGQEADAAAAERGKAVFAENDTCVACHGASGEGNRDLGAPALNDKIWLYGSTLDDVVSQIKSPKHGVMPAWGVRLGDAGVKSVAAYVYSLGGGEKVE
jgi:cytochrome c oxidase cbb3-type subunit 3